MSRVVGSNPPPGPVIISGAGGDVARVPGPFLRGAALVVGPSSVRDSGVGFGARADVLLGEALDGRLQPYVGLEWSRAGVEGTLSGAGYSGNVTTYGAGAGVGASLPTVVSVAPELRLGLVGLGGSTSGPSPSEATVVQSLYEGFVMGPRIAIDAIWRENTSGNWKAVSSLARTWAGARSGWSFQIGLRWSRPFVRQRTILFEGQPAPSETLTDRPEVGQPTPDPAPAAPVDSSRIMELENALAAERDARMAAEAAADVIREAQRAAESRTDSVVARQALEARADSLATRRMAEAQQAEALRLEEAAEAERARRESLRVEIESLVGILEGLQDGRETPRGLEITFGGGIFPTGGTSLEGLSRTRVLRIGRVLAEQENAGLTVEGHTDATGSVETNRLISEQRAEAIRDVLLDAGLSAAAIDVRGRGESEPIATNDTPAGRALNRRVVVVVRY